MTKITHREVKLTSVCKVICPPGSVAGSDARREACLAEADARRKAIQSQVVEKALSKTQPPDYAEPDPSLQLPESDGDIKISAPEPDSPDELPPPGVVELPGDVFDSD